MKMLVALGRRVVGLLPLAVLAALVTGENMTPRDLADHDCINYRQASSGGIYAWEFEKEGQELTVKVNGTLTFNDIDLISAAALDGRGLAFCFEDQVGSHISSGRLVRVLEDWCPPYAGFHLYYPSRRQTPALKAIIEHLRFRA